MGGLFNEKRYNMVTISIASLIYKSKKYADWVHDSIHEFTPQLKRGEAEFFFVANDPTEELLAHLQQKGYKHYVNRNPVRTEEELFKTGYGAPLHIHRVYRGYNKAIESAEGEIVVLVNSDNYFSPDWLENLLKYVSAKTIVCSKLVERMHPEHSIFPGAYRGEFGSHPDTFNKDAFLKFCERVKITGLQLGGSYMPCAFHKRLAIQVGLYPEGNLAGASFRDVVATGDEIFFRKLSKAGLRHVTAMDSIVYHTKEGEMDELDSPQSVGYPIMSLEINPGKIESSEAQQVEPVVLKTEGKRQYLAVPGIHESLFKLRKTVQKKRSAALSGIVMTMQRWLPARLYNALRAIWHLLVKVRQ
jgi:glycosyltransferase involved in cell wall biosynthesis